MQRTKDDRRVRAQQQAVKAEAARRADARARAIRVGRWSVYRFDDHNWALDHDDDREGDHRYFPDLMSALKAVLSERIGERASGDLRSVAGAVAEATAEILSAVQPACARKPTKDRDIRGAGGVRVGREARTRQVPR